MPSFIQFEVCKLFWQRAQVSKHFIFSNFWNCSSPSKKGMWKFESEMKLTSGMGARAKISARKIPSKPIRSFFPDPITFFSTRVRSDSIFKFWNGLPRKCDHIWSQNVRSDRICDRPTACKANIRPNWNKNYRQLIKIYRFFLLSNFPENY
jgi:hypothetical protein